MEITFTTELSHIDWDRLKAAVAADKFDNGRTPAQMRISAQNSFINVFALTGDEIIGTARALSDGVCNAYVVDMWTKTAFRMRGIARQMMEIILARVPGQHVYLAADDDVSGFYDKLGFSIDGQGLSRVVGRWLHNESLDS